MMTAHRLREIRESTGLSMNKFARSVGVTTSSWSLYESGKRLPTIATCYKIIDFMRAFGRNLTIEWLRPE